MDGHAISHLGWGLNPQARWDAIALNGADPKRHHAGARCFAGNFLFSTGPNSQGGGKRTTKGHYDVPMRDCTVTLDNDVIIEVAGLPTTRCASCASHASAPLGARPLRRRAPAELPRASARRKRSTASIST